MIKRINKFCKYFPCHKGLEDCTFCYCPFYPCKDEKLGKYIKKIWSCKNCTFLHKKKNVDYIFNFLLKNKDYINKNLKG